VVEVPIYKKVTTNDDEYVDYRTVTLEGYRVGEYIDKEAHVIYVLYRLSSGEYIVNEKYQRGKFTFSTISKITIAETVPGGKFRGVAIKFGIGAVIGLDAGLKFSQRLALS